MLCLRGWFGEATVDGLVIDHEFKLVHSTAGGLAVIPDLDGTDGSRLVEDYRNEIGFPLIGGLGRRVGCSGGPCELEGCQPHIPIVKHLVLAIEQLVQRPDVVLHPWDSVDACRICHDVLLRVDCHNVAQLIIELQAIKADVVVVTMR